MSDEAAARLIERVLTDAAFRTRFRADPAAAAREAGLDPAEELPEGRAFETLELRESKSSLAGAMMAAAVEGIGLYDVLGGHGGPGVAGHAELASADVGADDGDDGDEDLDGGTGDDGDDPDQDLDGDGETDDDGDDEDEPDDEEPDEEEPDEEEPDQDEDEEDEDEEDEDDGSDDSDDSDESDGSDGSDGGDDSDDGGGSGESDGSDGSDVAPLEQDLGDVDADYPGDDAPREQVARWMAAAAQRRGLPAELPVMASLVESGMHNLSGGDRDSVGFFQMRVGIWNQGAYAGYPDDPSKQIDWFLDTAEAVKAQRLARGQAIDDPAGYGEWIADVERPAEQYRGRYQLRLDEARGLLRRTGGQEEEIAGELGAAALHAGPLARAALAEAREHLGTPYRWGGSSPKTGFDCSGLVQWAYAEAGIRIPRVTDQQILAEGATKVGRKRLLPGDLVFFRDSTGYVHHVGMSLGGDRFIHAPHTGDVVKISSLDEPYYAEQFTGGRRFDHAVAGSRVRADHVTAARTALAHDADEVSRPGTALFEAVRVQEQYKGNQRQVLPAITPDQVVRRR